MTKDVKLAERDIDDNFELSAQQKAASEMARKLKRRIDMSDKGGAMLNDVDYVQLSRLAELLNKMGSGAYEFSTIKDVYDEMVHNTKIRNKGTDDDGVQFNKKSKDQEPEMTVDRFKELLAMGKTNKPTESFAEGLGDMAHLAEQDHEVQMARAELYKLAKYAIKLHEMLKGISEREGLEGWQQAKITKAADYIGSVYHALEYDTVSESKKVIKSTMTESDKTAYKNILAEKMLKKKVTNCSECNKPSYTTLSEEKQKGVDGKVCWKGYKRMGTKKKGGKTVDNCVKM
jgi:hypothetical protein|tara:strand:- start:5244 stop:6107 length:864 start_codon:yes stop_codon:yes gene_type:complete